MWLIIWRRSKCTTLYKIIENAMLSISILFIGCRFFSYIKLMLGLIVVVPYSHTGLLLSHRCCRYIYLLLNSWSRQRKIYTYYCRPKRYWVIPSISINTHAQNCFLKGKENIPVTKFSTKKKEQKISNTDSTQPKKKLWNHSHSYSFYSLFFHAWLFVLLPKYYLHRSIPA